MKSWEKFYQKELNTSNTLECKKCGSMLMGDSPILIIMCKICWDNIRGVYPDGFTCAGCGKKIYDSFPVIKKGTFCKNCA